MERSRKPLSLATVDGKRVAPPPSPPDEYRYWPDEHDEAAQSGPMYPMYVTWVMGMELAIPEFREQRRYERLMRWANASRPTFGLLWEFPTGPRWESPPLRTVIK